MLRHALFTTLALTALTATAAADDGPPPTSPTPMPDATMPQPPPDEQPPPEEEKPKQPGKGDFDAGGQVRLPNGPDENDEFASFNWIAVDLEGRYFLLDSVTVNGNIPLAVKKPDMLMNGADPRMVGGMLVTLEAKLPKMDVPMAPKNDSEIGVVLGGAFMREGAMLLSEKDYPLFTGDFKPGLDAGLIAKVKLSSLLDFAMTPVFVYQAGSDGAIDGVQIPTSTIVKLGKVVKASVDLGVYSGDGFTFRGSKNGRIAAGAALDLKLGPMLVHLGAGFASLLTGGPYPTVGDSVYFDLNAKYAK